MRFPLTLKRLGERVLYNFHMDKLDRLLREMTFEDHWRDQAIREGVMKGVIYSTLLFTAISVVFLYMYWDLLNPLSQSACYAIYV